MIKARLLKLAEVLENFKEERKILVSPVKKFDMDTWYSCGTAACALGTAMLHPWFRRRGLRHHLIWGGEYEPVLEVKGDGDPDEDFAAGATFFGISQEASYHLFDPGEYDFVRVRPRTVARRIREFVASNGEIPEHA